jgi:hypothetical protein
VNKRCHNLELRSQHLDVTGVGTSRQVVFPVGCLCIVLCCNGVDFWCLGGLPPDIYRINDEISVIITFLIWRREFFLAAQREAVFSNGGCEVLECRSTTHHLQGARVQR